MRKSVLLRVLAVLAGGVAACSSATEGAPDPSITNAKDVPATASQGDTLAYFEATVSPSLGTMEFRYLEPPSSAISPQQSLPTPLPYGTGTNQVYLHTVYGSEHWNGGTSQLTATVEAWNKYPGSIGNFTATIDSISTPVTVSIGAPFAGSPPSYNYGTASVGENVVSGITWTFTDVGGGNFSFKGHVSGNSTPPNCQAIKVANPASPSGMYTIAPAGAGITAYCDMTTAGGGWTEVVDQDVTIGAGYQTASTWLNGFGTANSGQYSILNLLGSLHSGSNYEMRIEWPGMGYVQWTQVQNPTSLNATLPTLVGAVLESPTGQTGGTGVPFIGLYNPISVGGGSVLGGDANIGYWWFAVGSQANFSGGIPGYVTAGNTFHVFPHVKLSVR